MLLNTAQSYLQLKKSNKRNREAYRMRETKLENGWGGGSRTSALSKPRELMQMPRMYNWKMATGNHNQTYL